MANTVARDRRHTHTQALLPSCRNKSTSAKPRCTRTHRHIKDIGKENSAQTHFTTMDIDTDIDTENRAQSTRPSTQTQSHLAQPTPRATPPATTSPPQYRTHKTHAVRTVQLPATARSPSLPQDLPSPPNPSPPTPPLHHRCLYVYSVYVPAENRAQGRRQPRYLARHLGWHSSRQGERFRPRRSR